jgi:hypothetical protein
MLSHLVIALCGFTLLLHLDASSYCIVLSCHFVALFCSHGLPCCFVAFFNLLHCFVTLPRCFFFVLKKKLFMNFF